MIQVVLWLVVSIFFIISLVLFVPSIMSLGAPKYYPKNRKEYWINKAITLFLILVLAYPIVFFIAVLAKRFLGLAVVEFLFTYCFVLGLLYLVWHKTDRFYRS